MNNKQYLTKEEYLSYEYFYCASVIAREKINQKFEALRNELSASVQELKTNFKQELEELNK